ncbi:MAG: histidine kinase, partial [Spirosomaceae bacterium]|nr:histidine kinase [Spirosomataceae bacterium]
ELMYTKKLLRVALFSSPVMAIYGIAPLYVFNNVTTILFLRGVVFLSFVIFTFWLVNIVLIRRFGAEHSFLRYAASYISTFILLAIFLLISDLIIQQRPSDDVIYPILTGIASNTIIHIIIQSIVSASRRDLAELEVKELRIRNMEAQKNLLLQQFQPHFIFNALSTLKSLMKVNLDEAESYVLKLSDFLRFSVQADKRSVVSLAEELAFTNQYIEMQQIRFEGALQFHVNVPEEILNKQIPVFALQLLVENAIKHNTFSEDKPLTININYSEAHLLVSNNVNKRPFVESIGTGLVNLNQRYQQLGNCEIDITDSTNEFMVKIGFLD